MLEWIKIFKLFNFRKLRSSTILYLFVMVSIVIAVSISLSIPQIIFEKENYYSENATELNGAELKIETSFISSSFDEKIAVLEEEGVRVSRINIITTSFKNNTNRFLGSLLIGDYELEENEIVLYKDLAVQLNVKEKDQISIGSNTYVIKEIEKTSNGVDGQSATIGYGKVSSYPLENQVLSNQLLLIDCENGEKLKEELKVIEPAYKYTTIQDKQDSMQEELNMNATTLNVLNTMSCIMTILSVLSAIFVIVIQRQKDIAIMRMLSIRTKSIKKAMRLELYLMIFIPVFIGSILSHLLARILLQSSGIVFEGITSDVVRILLSGFLLFLAIYFIFIKIATIAINAISPLFITRNDLLSWKKSKSRIVRLSILFMGVAMCLYSIYIGRESALISSIAIGIFILIFFILIIIAINLFSKLPVKNNLFVYSIKNIRANKYAFVFTILSISLTIWFLLIGFTLEKNIRDSYTLGVEQKVNYNYLVVDDNPKDLEEVLQESEDVVAVTKLHRSSGTVVSEGMMQVVQICEINQIDYQIKFNVIEGDDLFVGSKEEVLVSSEFCKEKNYKLGDHIIITSSDYSKDYRIKGIYEAGGINQAMIIKPYEGLQDEKVLFLVKSDSGEFQDELTDASIMHISTMGMAMMNRINDFLSIFKWLCFICIFSSILFNLNIMYMGFAGEEKETLIIRAIGIGRGFLYQHLVFKFAITLIISMLMSLGLYIVMMKFALTAIFKVDLVITAATIMLPLGCGTLLIVLLFLLPFYIVKNAKGFDGLREQV